MDHAQLFKVFIDHFVIPRLSDEYLFQRKQYSTLWKELSEFVKNEIRDILKSDPYNLSLQDLIKVKPMLFRAADYALYLVRYLWFFMSEYEAGRRNEVKSFLKDQVEESSFMNTHHKNVILKHLESRKKISTRPAPLHAIDVGSTIVQGAQMQEINKLMQKFQMLLRVTIPTTRCQQERKLFADLLSKVTDTLENVSNNERILDPSFAPRLRSLMSSFSQHACYQVGFKQTVESMLQLVDKLVAKKLVSDAIIHVTSD